LVGDFGVSSIENIQERVCRKCGNLRPVHMFRWKGAAKKYRDTICRKCDNRREGEEARARKAAEREAGLRGLVQQVRATKLDVPHISEYLEAVLQKLGGVQVLASMHVDQIEMLLELRPGSAGAVKALTDISKLILASTEHRQSAPDLAQITDDQLNELLVQQLAGRLAENPNFLEDAAFELGYQLVPLAPAVDAEEVAPFEDAPALPTPGEEAPDA
jgi:hypothetical protein